jgi:dTMP kinase
METPGRLIAFEGGDGAGKTTQAERLSVALGAELTREPGGTVLGERIRRLLLDPEADAAGDSTIGARTELMLALAARAQHVSERIRPALDAGRDVVVDRFSASTLAYQGYGRGLPVGEVRLACDLATGGLWPDLTLLLQIPIDLGNARRAGAGSKPDRFESERGAFHGRVAEGFLELAAEEPSSWIVIDGSGDVDDVAQLVLDAVRRVLRPKAAG